jgi:hypothetical protein
MDLRAYYSRIREAEDSLSGDRFVTVSLATPEGGKAGVRTEASRTITARLIVEGRIRVATKEEADDFYETHRAAKERHEREEASRRLQVVVVQQPESIPHESRKQKDKA